MFKILIKRFVNEIRKRWRKSYSREFKKYSSIGHEELNATKEVIESGVLSQYLGAWHDDFYGGPKVKEFEKSKVFSMLSMQLRLIHGLLDWLLQSEQ